MKKLIALLLSILLVVGLAACDYVGLISGNNTPDKMEKAGFYTTKSEFVMHRLSTSCP